MPFNWNSINFGGGSTRSRTPYQNINFGSFPIGAEYAEDNSEEGNLKRLLDRMEQIYAKKGPSRTKYEELLSAPPEREDYKPSLLRKILGAMGGVSGYEYLTEQPYNRAMKDWGVKTEASRRGSELERLAAEDEAQALSRSATTGVGYEKFLAGRDATTNRNKIYAQSVQGQIDARKESRDLEEKRLETQGWKFQTDANYHRIGTNLLTGQVKDYGIDQDAYNRGQNVLTGQRNAATSEGNLDVNQRRLNFDMTKPPTEPKESETAIRNRAEKIVSQMNPAWYDNNGNLKPEFADDYLQAVNAQVQALKRNKDINLPGTGIQFNNPSKPKSYNFGDVTSRIGG